MSSEQVTLNLSEGSIRKLRALAVLSGRSYSEIADTLSATFDEMISQNIHSMVQSIDGISHSAPGYVTTPADPVGEKQVSPLVEKHDRIVEEAEPAHETHEDENSHALSNDDDEGTVAAADDPELQAIRDALPKVSAKNVGNNAEAFLDAALDVPEQVDRLTRMRNPARAFDPRSPRVKIRDYTGDESEDSGPLLGV